MIPLDWRGRIRFGPESIPDPSVDSTPHPDTYTGPEAELLHANPIGVQAQEVFTGYAWQTCN